ncbi:MAG: hypothetical protein WCK92_15060 [Bacteroidota bacterium]
MHLLAIALLSIFAGTLLLAKFRKDTPGKFFAFISWFFIVVGFILFIGFIAGGICRLTHHGCRGHHNCRHEMMMKECGPGMMKECGPGMMKECGFGMHDGLCCPKGMGKGMCSEKPGCSSHDSMMKCCPKHMGGDSAKMQVPKK